MTRSFIKQLGFTLILVSATAELATAVDARVLPRGRSRLSFTYGYAPGISQTYDQSGRSVRLTEPYNIELSAPNLRAADTGLSQMIDLLNNTGARYDFGARNNGFNGLTDDASKPLLGDALSRGFLEVDAEATRKQSVLSLQYGVTDRLTMGFGLPYLTSTVNVKYDITGTNTATDIYQILRSSYPQAYGQFQAVPGALGLVSASNPETLQAILVSKGYERFENKEQQGIGDLLLGGRYAYLDKENGGGQNWIASAQASTSLPTGSLKSPSQITAVDLGQGTWDVSAAHLVNYSFNPDFVLSHSINFTHRLENQRLMRVRENPADFLPNASSEESVTQQLGDKLWTTFGAKYAVTPALSFDTNLELYWKYSDQFQGQRAKDYTYLSKDTDFYLETLQFGSTLTTIPAFLGSKFPLPMDVAVNYYHPVRGRNAVVAPFWTAELSLYF